MGERHCGRKGWETIFHEKKRKDFETIDRESKKEDW